MADPIYELLLPYFDKPSPRPAHTDPITSNYISRLTSLPLSSLTTTESESLQQTTHSLFLSLQSLSKRSHKGIIDSSTHLSTLSSTLASIAHSTASLRDALPRLDGAALHFSETYNHRSTNPALDRRKKALLLSRNIDRLSDILDLPTLLSSAISSSNTSASSVSTTSSSTNNTNLNYATALDLNAHIRRLQGLYPESPLILSVTSQADSAMRDMTTNLITSLRTNSLKLAHAMRTISWLRRVAPELDSSHSQHRSSANPSREGTLGALFLVCRLANLEQTLHALEPLRELADQETLRLHSEQAKGSGNNRQGGQQTERYLKRYIEIFREQSFAIISMYRSIFPPAASIEKEILAQKNMKSGKVEDGNDALLPLPSALGTFPLRLVSMLVSTLRAYLPNVRERSGRDSLLTQVLYCAGSLGRLGGDFGLVLALLGDEDRMDEDGDDSEGEHNDEDEDEDDVEEWAEVIKKHRVLAGRLESMVGARDGS